MDFFFLLWQDKISFFKKKKNGGWIRHPTPKAKPQKKQKNGLFTLYVSFSAYRGFDFLFYLFCHLRIVQHKLFCGFSPLGDLGVSVTVPGP